MAGISCSVQTEHMLFAARIINLVKNAMFGHKHFVQIFKVFKAHKFWNVKALSYFI